MDLPKKQGNRREIGGFFEIHRIRWKTPKFGGVKNPDLDNIAKDFTEIDRSFVKYKKGLAMSIEEAEREQRILLG